MASKSIRLIIKKGLKKDINTATALLNELAITTDTRELYVGNDQGEFVLVSVPSVVQIYEAQDKTDALDYSANHPDTLVFIAK